MSTPPLPAGHHLQAAIFWTRFHLRRKLRRRNFKLFAAGSVLLYLALVFPGRASPEDLGQLFAIYLPGLLSLFFGTGVMREEIEDQTLTYSFSRPVGRAWLYAARTLASVAPVALITVPLAFISGTGTGPQTAIHYALAAFLGTAAYGALFALAGQLIKWPTWFGLVFLLFWEGGVSQVPGFLGRLTLVSHTRGIANLSPGDSPWIALWEAPSVPVAIAVLLAATAFLLFIGGQLVRGREFVLSK